FAPSFRESLIGALRARLTNAAVVASKAAPGVRVEQQLTDGHPVRALRAEAQRARLLVVGTRGLGGISGLLLGSVAEALVGQAACPVVVIRGDVDASPTLPVVVGVDGSPSGEAAIAFAYEEASVRGLPLIAVHT